MKNYYSPIVPDYGQNENHSHHNHTCPNCGSANLTAGAGLKPGQMSLKCSECKAFVGYIDTRNFAKLKKLRKRKQFTNAVNFIEQTSTLRGEDTLFILNEVGGER